MKKLILTLLFATTLVSANNLTIEKWQGEAFKLDGKLTEKAWNSGSSFSDFVPFTSERRASAEVDTTFMVRYDKDYLYFGVECQEPLMEKVKLQKKSLWFADGIEIFLVPTGKDSTYYQFRVNVDKNRFQQYYEEGGNIKPVFYAPQWDSAVALQEKSWTLEVRIPWNALYMTSSNNWSTKWRLNIARNRRIARQNISWSKLIAKCNEISRFRYMAGFPKKNPLLDTYVMDSVAKINKFDGKKFTGDLQFGIEVASKGKYQIKCITNNKTYTQTFVAKKDGRNKVVIPNVVFNKPGKNNVNVILTCNNTTITNQNFEVGVSFEPIVVKLSNPSYRNTFYPGQTAKTITGLAKINLDAKELAISFGKQPAKKYTIPKNSIVNFSIPAGKLVDGKHQLKFTIFPQKIEQVITVSKYSKIPAGKNVGWVENGKLIFNGKAILPRFLYAHYYLGGTAMQQRTDADDLALTGKERDYRLVCTPPRIIKGIEVKEGTKDIRPCQELFDKIKAIMTHKKNKNFLFYYLSDEPECRSQSAVYLKYLYEFIKENDPWHPVMICTRAPERYIDCADILSPHPYIGPTYDGNGKRYLNIPIYRVRNYINAISKSNRPDKIASFTGQFFSYKSNSIYADYPTFEELESQVWSTLANGARWYTNYAYHDLGDRPAIYEGTRYQMTSLRRLENFILSSQCEELKVKAQYNVCDAVVLKNKNDKLVIVVNLLDKAQKITVQSNTLKSVPVWHRFRENQQIKGNSDVLTFNLKPYECMVLSSKVFDKNLPLRKDVIAKIAKLEAARLSRPNVLLGKGLDIEISTSNPPRSSLGIQNKLFDGTVDMLAWQHVNKKTKGFIDMLFPKFVPQFSKVRVWGNPATKDIKISIRKAGRWQTPTPKKVTTNKWYVEFDYGTMLKTIRMKIEFPKRKVAQEVYEIELEK